MTNDGLMIADNNIYSFLTIGQSNMAGRGDISDIEEKENNKCFMLKLGRWQMMRRPINPDRGAFSGFFKSGVCLVEGFADRLQKHTQKNIGIIPCADGGTALSQWMPGEVLFDHAIMMSKLAMRTSTLSAILWHQGESDCRSECDIAQYKERFIKMITEMRRQLGNERIPVIIGELSHDLGENCLSWAFDDRPKRLNQIFHEIGNELPFCGVVSSEGLMLQNDGLHFDSRSLIEFGERYFEKYCEIAKINPIGE
ncbi:MAG: sialate O-acetylesterase [Clostridia bacterium]|nr:sialate O-acetylesterase [Clostridia bacterium]